MSALTWSCQQYRPAILFIHGASSDPMLLRISLRTLPSTEFICWAVTLVTKWLLQHEQTTDIMPFLQPSLFLFAPRHLTLSRFFFPSLASVCCLLLWPSDFVTFLVVCLLSLKLHSSFCFLTKPVYMTDRQKPVAWPSHWGHGLLCPRLSPNPARLRVWLFTKLFIGTFLLNLILTADICINWCCLCILSWSFSNRWETFDKFGWLRLKVPHALWWIYNFLMR